MNFLKKKLGGIFLPSFFILSLIFSLHFVQGTSSYKVASSGEMSSKLKQNLAAIIEEFVKIHHKLKITDDDFYSKTMGVIQQLDQIQIQKELKLPYHRRIYLIRQINLIKDHLRFVVQKNLSETRKKTSLKKLYSELVQIYHTYSLENEMNQYGVFYCSKNDSAWIQKEKDRVTNPFDSKYQSCGQKINP